MDNGTVGLRTLLWQTKKIITIVDRGEGATDNLKKEGLDLVAVFTMDDFR